MTEPAVSLHGVSKHYDTPRGRVVALDSVSLDVFRGQIVWMRGDSGSGKSTAIRVGGLLATPTSGEVRIDGRSVDSRTSGAHEYRRHLVATVFQASNLLPDLTLVENVLVADRAVPVAAALELLSELGLADVAANPAKTVSGGQAQRAAICRAMVGRRQIVLADEPTSGLDTSHADSVRALLRRCADGGAAVVVASHDDRTKAVADTVVELREGRVV